MPRRQMIFRALRRRLLTRASALAMQVALRPRGWAPGLLAMGLIGAPAAAGTIDLTDAGLIIQGAAPGDLFGYSVSAARDVNGDGIDDLIIGAPLADDLAGATYVIFGTDRGLPAVLDLADAADVIIQGAAPGDVSGVSVSGADVNGDGIDDLIIGARQATPDGRDLAGVTYVVFGASDLSGIIDLADPVNGADLIIQGAAAYDFSGSSVDGAGDVNGDGVDDLIIVATTDVSYLVFGSDQGLPATIDLATEADVVIQGPGRPVRGAGDVNGDGIADLIVGDASASPSGRSYAGAVYVILGSDQGLPATIDPAAEADVVIQGAATYDGAGRAVGGAGDVNGDGVDDLIIGAPYADPKGLDEAGASYVILGSEQGLPATIDLAEDADLVIQGAAARDRSGRPVGGAGDVNGDGVGDLIVGAQFAGPSGRDEAGISYVILGSEQGWAATIDLADGADLTIQGAAADDRSGHSIGAGDVNGDGIDDLIIGAPYADPNGRDYAGASHVVFGGPAAALKRLIAAIEAAGLPGRLERSLTKKLRNARGSLSRGEMEGATRKIGTFISQLEAQRGKQIDEAEADGWITAAKSMVDLLSTS